MGEVADLSGWLWIGVLTLMAGGAIALAVAMPAIA